ncbi:MAG: aminotransferase class I/II-fold pyridoxal phosphate-dependent enzyme [Chloroflexi bacterium]|nr:aminotransferase class I/II-fold pyridoxal phosphate-dependent enzyme [Chloroflexota bacterium]
MGGARAVKLAKRMSNLGTETAFEVLVKANALAATGVDVVHLELGEPDFDTPGHIIDAAKEALDGGFTHYGPAAGLPDVRARIAEHTSEARGITVSPDNVIVTPHSAGTSAASTAAGLTQIGDETARILRGTWPMSLVNPEVRAKLAARVPASNLT